MKLNTEINKETMEYFYREYKALLIPIFAIIISILLILFFLVPQLTAFPGKKTEVESENLKLKKLNEVKLILQTSNAETVDDNLAISAKALPIEKNFELILRAISQSADKSGALVDGYSFKATPIDPASTLKFLKVEFSLEIEADSDQTVAFMRELSRTFPISEITSVKYSGARSSLVISFFYKPVDAGGVYDRTQIRSLTSEEQNILSEILSWDDNSDAPIEIIDSSSSGQLGSDPSPF